MNEFVQFFSFFWEEDLELVIAATIFSILCFIFVFFVHSLVFDAGGLVSGAQKAQTIPPAQKTRLTARPSANGRAAGGKCLGRRCTKTGPAPPANGGALFWGLMARTSLSAFSAPRHS